MLSLIDAIINNTIKHIFIEPNIKHYLITVKDVTMITMSVIICFQPVLAENHLSNIILE